MELVSEGLLPLMGVAIPGPPCWLAAPHLSTEDAPSRTHRTCCLDTGLNMWPKTHHSEYITEYVANHSDGSRLPDTQKG